MFCVLQHVLDIFGADRCMLGSDWPVCRVANAEYKDVLKLAEDLLENLSDEDKKKVFYKNAVSFYNLKL